MYMERRKITRYPIIRRAMQWCDKCNEITDHQVTIWNERGERSSQCQRCEAKENRKENRKGNQ